MGAPQLRADRRALAAPVVVAARADHMRQGAVAVAVLFAVLAGLLGLGIGGTPLAETQGGALGSAATLLAPAGAVVGLGVLIGIGLIAYAVWQALPAQRTEPRQRSVGGWIALSAVLGGVWSLLAQWGPLWSTAVAAVLMLAAVCVAYHRVVRGARERSAWTDLVLVDGVTGLLLGAASVLAVVNVTAVLREPLGPQPLAEVWASAVLAALLALGVIVSATSRWRVAPPWAMGWGALWIGVARLSGEPESLVVGVLALAVAVVLLVLPTVVRLSAALRDRG